MPLLPPRVIDPLSECSHSVRVEGQITGATVEVFMIGPGDVLTMTGVSYIPTGQGIPLTSRVAVRSITMAFFCDFPHLSSGETLCPLLR
jgi:hypothetical protein